MEPLPPPETRIRQVTALFEGLADTYDTSDVAFSGPVGAELVRRLAPQAGERAVDLGCARGAVTFPLAEAVGAEGHVDALDLAPSMVELTAGEAQQRGASQVEVVLGDAVEPPLEESSYDVLASSLLLFFLPEPDVALTAWRRLVRPGGRAGFTTFGAWPPAWQAVLDVFDDHARRTGRRSMTQAPEVDEDQEVTDFLTGAGWSDVEHATLTHDLVFDDLDHWRRWSLTTWLTDVWMRSPVEEHPEILDRVGEVLEGTRGDDGRLHLHLVVRYTLARP